MTLITHTEPKVLIAEEGKYIRSINDVYEPEHIDEETGETIPEHFPYYSAIIFPAAQIDTIEKAKELYIEEDIESK